MNREEAIIFISFMVGRIGGGFHPDHEMCEYDMCDGQEFSEEEKSRFDQLLGQAHKVLGEEIYQVSMRAMDICIPIMGDK